jgi:hypothetical protein
MAMGRPAQYIIIDKLVEIIDDYGLRADIFGAAKIGFVLKPEIMLLSFTEIEVVVHPDDWALFDELVRKEFNTSPNKIEPHKRYAPGMNELTLLRSMYDYKYCLGEDLGYLRITVALRGLRDYFNPTRRVFSLTKYLNRYREAPFEYLLAAKLIIPPGVFDRCDCEQLVFGFMFSEELFPWSFAKLVKIVASIVSKEPRYGGVVAKNIDSLKECLRTRLIHLLISEEKRAKRLLRRLDKLYSTVMQCQAKRSHF